MCDLFYFFFFQAEDGIRDPLVTGVQTCALPISRRWGQSGRLACLWGWLKGLLWAASLLVDRHPPQLEGVPPVGQPEPARAGALSCAARTGSRGERPRLKLGAGRLQLSRRLEPDRSRGRPGRHRPALDRSRGVPPSGMAGDPDRRRGGAAVRLDRELVPERVA